MLGADSCDASAAWPRMTLDAIRHWLTRAGLWTTRPAAFAVLAVFALAWFAFGEKFGWTEIATLATLVMTLFIQRAEHRDTQALHAKLDELLRTHGEARSDLDRLDQEEPEEIERHREEARGLH